MPTPKKSLLACVSAAALVASFGFVQAQSTDQDAAAMANVNNGVDRGADQRSYPADSLAAPNTELAYEAPAAGPATEPATSPWAADRDNSMAGVNSQAAADTSGSQVAGSPGYQPNVGIDGTPGIPEGSAGQRSSVYDPATASGNVTSPSTSATTSSPAMGTTAPASDLNAAPAPAPAPATAQPSSNLTVTSAPETRVDLSPPSEPLYNLPNGERAPRPDRN